MSRLARPLPARTRRQIVEQVAPRYRQASFAQKILLLDAVVAATGYARKYAITLLNQMAERTHTIQQHPPLSLSRSEVLQALFFAWNVANWICAKRLIPFLPTLIDALERHGHLHLSEESRNHLLRVSPATAERLLHTQRQPAPQGLSTTKAGSLLKHQIPIRTFQQWDETQPGFLEADLVAHCGGHPEGSFLYTLTLTDIATGWTECLPLLYRSPEMVEAALLQAQTLFPFPILGIDTDNGKEFINELILAYCEREHLTFTRGRPECKNDQCHVEQKNGAVVRPFVGYGRFMGEQASRQLRELYRALRLYVNCFQPSMKLHSKSYDGQRMRRVYDPAKTPLQRLLLSGILPEERQHELREVVRALDPLSLFEQVKQLQQAFLHHAISSFSSSLTVQAPSLLRFSLDQCFNGPLPASTPETSTPPLSAIHSLQEHHRDCLDWPRTTKDPFEGEWERILAEVLAHPERSSGDLFQELQQQFPGRYQPSQLGTLQRGVRKIRAHLLHIQKEPWPSEVIQAPILPPIKPGGDLQQGEPVFSNRFCLQGRRWSLWRAAAVGHTERGQFPVRGSDSGVNKDTHLQSHEENQPVQGVQIRPLTMTIESAIQAYLQEQMDRGSRRKTLEWHQTALRFLQQYLLNRRHLRFLSQITEKEVRGWLASLRTPSSLGSIFCLGGRSG